jgi:hypothetical protein
MPPALSADPISPSPIERPLRPPNQQSLTMGDTDAHCISLESSRLTFFHRLPRAEGAATLSVSTPFELSLISL